jgi:hypothetical protein
MPLATTLPPELATVDPAVLDAFVDGELDRRRQAAAAARAERKDERAEHTPAPTRGRYRAITSGKHKARLKPRATVEDRRWVPGVLRHWRRVHDLSPAQALARIGYSSKSSTWRHWEAGFVAPPYEALLLIIAATGLGHWIDQERRAEIPPQMLLEYTAAQHKAALRRARRRRRAAVPA